MSPDVRIFLSDVEQAARDIAEYLEGFDMDAYSSDGEKQASVERKFKIIGEALNRLRGVDPELAGRIPDLRQIIDFRNLLSHGYDQVDSVRVWSYAKNNLPELHHIVQILLKELGQPEQ
ncbi:MAG: DUF86 domain-containing protein [Gammaproteobacteria bacterium]|nr:DUF86 domain-containing protein [Gammaproteobacteria bacterium]